MKKILIGVQLLLFCCAATAQNKYAADLIAKNLLAHASAVVRNEEITTEVKDLDNTIYHVKRAITILNKNGDDKIGLDIYYDKITSIKSIKGTIYNEVGGVIRKIPERDFEDVAATDGFSLFQDDRVKYYKKAVAEYPYTVEYEYELKSKQSLGFPDWAPNALAGIAIEKSSYTFTCNPDYNIRYKQFNIPTNVVTGTNKEHRKTYNWQISDLNARRNEPMSPYKENTEARVSIAPEKFIYYNVGGTFTNWNELGKWVYDKLVSARQQLPSETIQHVKDMTKDIPDPKLKAKKIYEYMQSKTHYVNVLMGIGGIQPFMASEVDQQSYGDCKALVNYTQALLRAVDIDSYYCIVKSGRDYKVDFQSDFASMTQGDHIILCLPFKSDTTWADCTSQTYPFGFLGPFTDDRTVLACTPEGGKLMRTPKYATEENLEKRKGTFVLNEAGSLSGEMETLFKGADYDHRDLLIEEAPADQVKDIGKYYHINNMEIAKLEFKQDKGPKPFTAENIKLSAPEYAALDSNKIYFSLNSVNRLHALPSLMNRVNPVYINRGHTDEDEITYTLPKGYHLESEPLNKTIVKPFGIFSASMSINGNQLVYKRKFQLKEGTYSKETYQDLVDFYELIADADEYNVMLVKN